MGSDPPSDRGAPQRGPSESEKRATVPRVPESIHARAAELIALGKTTAAASLYADHGDHARASALLEEACDFGAAAREALAAGDPKRALLLGALGGDDALCARAIGALSSAAARPAAMRTADELAARGLHAHAGTLLSTLGDHAGAAQAFLEAGDARRAAAGFELAGRPADGARALEAALRRDPHDSAARLLLGRLLARHGRTEAAIRALQQLPLPSPERAEALPLLARCLAELGFNDAAKSARDEMAALGIADKQPPDRAADDDAPAGHAARAPHARAPRPLLFGRYEAVREAASTPHARVVEAVDRITAVRVAVKIFAGAPSDAGRDALLRFEREARALAELRHPNVVPLHAYLPEGPAMVLAWMVGGSLADKMRDEPMAPGRAAEIACSILAALGEAHRLGILHRDVKPTNVLFDEVGTAYLSDFGAAHLGDLSSTATAGAIGTFAYMSPEQRIGQAASMASDLYGVGAVLFELLTGEPAAKATDGRFDEPLRAHNPDLVASHDAVLARMLDEDPRGRPGDAFEARRAIQAVAWPDRIPPRRQREARPPSVSPPNAADARLRPARDAGDGRDARFRRHDSWIGRDVLVLPLDDAGLSPARAFARAGHPALPAVLRIDSVEREIWIAAPAGRALADEPRALSPGQRARLRDAIAALHEAGGAHGCVDPDHLYWHDGEVTLAYPRAPAGSDAAERDRAALDRLDES